MLAQGRGRWAVSQKRIVMIHITLTVAPPPLPPSPPPPQRENKTPRRVFIIRFSFCAGLDKLTQGHGLLQVCFIFIFWSLKWPEPHKATFRVARLNSLKYNGQSTSYVKLKPRFSSSLSCVVGWQSLRLLLWIFQFSRKRCSISGRLCATLIISFFIPKAAENNPWFFVIAIFRFPVQKAKEGFI